MGVELDTTENWHNVILHYVVGTGWDATIFDAARRDVYGRGHVCLCYPNWTCGLSNLLD